MTFFVPLMALVKKRRAVDVRMMKNKMRRHSYRDTS